MSVEIQYLWSCLSSHLPTSRSPPVFAHMCGRLPCLLPSRYQQTLNECFQDLYIARIYCGDFYTDFDVLRTTPG